MLVRKNPKPTLKTLLKSESGMMTWATIFSVLVLMIMFSFVFNAVKTVNRKVETQSAADSVAYSSSVWIARGMNALTATNHIIGELNAIYSLHHALGGKYLDNHASDEEPNDTDELERLNDQIDLRLFIGYEFDLLFTTVEIGVDVEGYEFAKNFCSPKPLDRATDMVLTNPVADRNSTIYEGKRDLKGHYRTALYWHVVGGVLEKFGGKIPYIGVALTIAGKGIQYLAFAAEIKIYTEYLMLEGLEIVAIKISDSGLKRIVPEVISALHLYQKLEIYVRTPGQAYRVANEIAEQNFSDASGFVRGDVPGKIPSFDLGSVFDSVSEIYPKMPVTLEDTNNENRSQLIRATYPWVAYWRRFPIKLFSIQRLEFKIPWPFSKTIRLHSRFAEYYRKWTNVYSRQASEWLRTPKDEYYDEMLTIENYEIKNGRPSGRNAAKGKNVRLFVMLDLNERHDSSKSQEVWNTPTRDGSYRADEIFCLIGFAKRPSATIWSPKFFRQENPNGFLCYSQAMIYNGNPQQDPAVWSGQGNHQARVGWDTLNWSDKNSFGKSVEQGYEWQYTTMDKTVSSAPPGLSGWQASGSNREHHKPPGIKLNWQAKLTPLTPQKMLKILSTQTLGTILSGDEEIKSILMTNREAQLYLQNH